MQNAESAQSDKNLNNIIKINEAQIQEHLGQMVRSTVEETLVGEELHAALPPVG